MEGQMSCHTHHATHVKIVARITYTVLVETLNHAQSINQFLLHKCHVVKEHNYCVMTA